MLLLLLFTLRIFGCPLFFCKFDLLLFLFQFNLRAASFLSELLSAPVDQLRQQTALCATCMAAILRPLTQQPEAKVDLLV